MVNKVILVGRLGADPEDAVGNRPLTFSMATSEIWKDKATGERRERAHWHNIVVFQERAQTYAGQYLKKGSQVYVEGMMVTRKWTDKNGIDRYSTEVLVKGFGHRVEGLDRANGSGYKPGGSLDEYGYEESGPPVAGENAGAKDHQAPLGGSDEYQRLTGRDPNAPPRTSMDTQFDQRALDDEIPF